MTNLSALILVFIGGLIVGSFLNVVICRLPEIKSIIFTRSHCPKCKVNLAWYDLIPLLSFVMLEQKCRHCGKQISCQYPLVELFTALMGVLIFYFYGWTSLTIFLSVITCLLMVIFVYDLHFQLILDEILVPLLLIIVAYLLFYPSIDMINKLIGAGAGLAIIGLIYVITKGKGIGFADIKLIVPLGLVVGWPKVLILLFMAFVIGAIIGLFLINRGKKGWKDPIAFGPFLIIGFYIALFWGEKILNWYLGL